MKIATWNVNSLRVRLPHITAWSQDMDILALQETKVTDELFPIQALNQLGFYSVFTGQKTYNGVALLSRFPIEEVETDVLGWIDEQRRFIAATINDIRIVCLYVPNGEAVGSIKFEYKLLWLKNLINYLQESLKKYPKMVVLGDFNIAPEDKDTYDPKIWQDKILCSAEERMLFQALLDLGFIDSFRLFEQGEQYYSWWDYRANSFPRNLGLRIDHILLSSILTTYCQQVIIDKTPRGWSKPSDHTPVWCELSI